MNDWRAVKRYGIRFSVVEVAVMFYTLALFVFNVIMQSNVQTRSSYSIVFAFSWLGILSFGFILYTYRIISGRYFSLYSIFVLFLYLFNFGQCFLWAFGIHLEKEIISSTVYGYFYPTYSEVACSQLVFITSSMVLHVFVIRGCRKASKNRVVDIDTKHLSYQRRVLFQASLFLAVVVIPVSFYYSIIQYIRGAAYGYRALYYGNVMDDVSGWVSIVNRMFFPCLLGLLIGSNYRKSVKWIVYGIFAAYSMIGLLTGDRGSWIYSLMTLVWIHHTYCKKIKWGAVLFYGLIAYFALYVLSAIVSVRNVGITWQNVLKALASLENNPVFSTVLELGNSMGINVLLIHDKPVYPYGNSYFMAMIGFITTKVPSLLGLEYSTLTKWISQEYLGLRYGAGFTVMGEAIVNTNVYMAPLVFVLYGLLFRRLWSVDETEKNPVRVFLAVSACTCLYGVSRSTTHELLKQLFFGILPFMLLMWLIRQKNRRRNMYEPKNK